jgi:hypothetical protein
VKGKAEDGANQDAKAAPERGGGKTRAETRTPEWPYSSSLFVMGSMESFLEKQG